MDDNSPPILNPLINYKQRCTSCPTSPTLKCVSLDECLFRVKHKHIHKFMSHKLGFFTSTNFHKLFKNSKTELLSLLFKHGHITLPHSEIRYV